MDPVLFQQILTYVAAALISGAVGGGVAVFSVLPEIFIIHRYHTYLHRETSTST
jgi:hypothetical protein